MRPVALKLAATLLGVLAAAGLAACELPGLNRAAEEVAVGDCFTRVDGGADLARATCEAETLTVLRILEVGDPATCTTVTGAHSTATVSGRRLCLGTTGADPARDANTATVGDCLAGDGDRFERTSCSAADANYEVLERRTDVALTDEEMACLDVPGTTVSYSWSWLAADEVDADSSTIDVVLCLTERASTS